LLVDRVSDLAVAVHTVTVGQPPVAGNTSVAPRVFAAHASGLATGGDRHAFSPRTCVAGVGHSGCAAAERGSPTGRGTGSAAADRVSGAPRREAVPVDS